MPLAMVFPCRRFSHLMISLLRTSLFLLALVLSNNARSADVYIVAGQSNGWRLGSIAGVAGEADAPIHYFGMSCSSRPDTAKMQVIEKLHPSSSGTGLAGALQQHSGREIIFIQYCVCGTSLGDVANWYPGDDPLHGKANEAGLYGSFTRYLADARRQIEALGIEWNVKGLFWHQGEADIKRSSAEHEKNLTNLLARFRHDLGAELPVIAGHIRDLNDGSRGINRALDAVAAADSRMAVVKLDGLPFESPTDVHVKPEGCRVLGERMVEALKTIESSGAR